MSQPANIFTTQESMELERMVQMREPEKLAEWCVLNGERLAQAVKAWTAVEELLRRAHVAELGWWNDPGQYIMKLSLVHHATKGFDLESVDDDEEWYGDDLADCIQNTVADVLAAEENMDAEDAEDAA
ncbi:MAG: hypothetical protein IT167_18560 [Bryobacterales bacterium]|nr:hypothetical protein [Bryobacterales bacterium]